MKAGRALAKMVAGCLGVAVLAGCDTTKAPGEAQADPLLRAMYPKVAALEGLEDYLVFSEPSVELGSGRPLSVSVPIRARTDEQLNIQYRFEFFDRDGRPVQPAMDWRYLLLPGRAQRFLQGAALDTSAVDWRLEVRPAR